MSIAASLLSIALFLAFGSSGAQKIAFTVSTSRTAEHLGYTKRGFQRIGVFEVVGAVALIAGLAARRGAVLGVINEAAAGAFFVMMCAAAIAHRRKGDRFAVVAPSLVLGVVSLVALVCRAA